MELPVAASASGLVFVDLETTGARAGADRITEIGIVEVDGAHTREWSTLVNPGIPIPGFIQGLTGITDLMVAGAPDFAQLATEVLERLRGRLFVAHNARFDFGFLQAEFARLGMDFTADVLCTVKLSRRLFPQFSQHRLDALVQRHALVAQERHRALGDARLICQFWRHLEVSVPEAELQRAAQALTQRSGCALELLSQRAEQIPEGWGVYIFYDQAGEALAVEPAARLRERVRVCLGARSGADARLAAQVHRVDWVETGGELGASLTQARLANQLRPRRGKRRAQGDLLTWRLAEAEGVLRPGLVSASQIDLRADEELCGLFLGEPEARKALRALVEEHALCWAALGLEEVRAPGGCQSWRQGRCRGACVGEETARAHNARLLAALAPLRLATWPHPGPVGVREGPLLHVIDQWRYLGSAGSDTALEDLLELPRPGLDRDTYQVLRRHLPGLRVHRLGAPDA